MTVLEYTMIYFLVGAVCGACIEFIFHSFGVGKDITMSERALWVSLWPYFVFVFVSSMMDK